MKPLSKSDLGPRSVRGPRRPDLAARVRGRARTLRAHIGSREALADVIRQANATLEPDKVAEWLVSEAQGWVTATCWGVSSLSAEPRRLNTLTRFSRLLRPC